MLQQHCCMMYKADSAILAQVQQMCASGGHQAFIAPEQLDCETTLLFLESHLTKPSSFEATALCSWYSSTGITVIQWRNVHIICSHALIWLCQIRLQAYHTAVSTRQQCCLNTTQLLVAQILQSLDCKGMPLPLQL